jgi:phytanoyl-CoA dioxygenase PhyH
MHRNRTRFASRVAHVAHALERRGVIATYEVHDRLLSNRSSRRRHARDGSALDDVQRRILTELTSDGYAVLAFEELFPQGEWQAIDEAAARFIADTEADLAGEARENAGKVHRREGKEFVVRRYDRNDRIDADDPWFRLCTSRRMLDLANTYLGMWSKLEYLDWWYSPPAPDAAERVSSQRWHRDFNDRHLLKAFLYLVDVDAGAGPFEYVPGSTGGGPYANEWPWRPLGTTYPDERELAERVPPSAVKTFTAPKGTMIFCNTSGFHRGGFATTSRRVLATVTYCSPASLASLTERNYERPEANGAEPDPVVEFALS